jgi:hypothetical protein
MYAAHSRRLAGEAVPIHDGMPEPGWYRMRAVKNGPWLPVHIFFNQVIDDETGELAEPEDLRAERMGRAVDPVAIWTYCQPISREAFDALVERHRTEDVMAATHTAVDLSTTIIRPGG